MKNIMFSIVFFSILINLSVGLMATAVPGFQGFDEKLGVDSNASVQNVDNEVEDSFGNPINIEPSMQDPQDVETNTLIDKGILGGISQIKNFLNKYMFGFVTLLQSIFPSSAATILLFSIIKTVISILYILTGIQLITGRTVM